MNEATGGSSDLEPSALAPLLTTERLGRAHLHVPVCVSTNDLAAAEARRGAAEGLLVTADQQTGGRGRQGRSWHSPIGDNIYASVLLRPRRPAHEIPPLTLLVGGALAEAVAGLGMQFKAWVKWPNDLLLADAAGGRKKVAGILTEAVTEGDRVGHVVVGMGINVNTRRFPDDLTAKATSLWLALDDTRAGPLSRADVLARLLRALETAYGLFETEGVAAAIRMWERYADIGRACRTRVAGHDIDGVIAGVAADGALLVESRAGQRHRIVAGEVVMLDGPPGADLAAR